MKKFTKKLVASILSGAMLMGMSLTAFAADAQPQGVGVSGYSGSGKQITKTWSVAENGLFNDSETFDFALKYTGADAIGTNATSTPTYNGNAMTQNHDAKTVQITSAWKTKAAGGVSSSETLSYDKLFEGISFTAPGLYHFTLNETAGSNPNIAYSNASYLLDVQVVWDTDGNGTQTGNLKVAGIATKEASTKNKSAGAGFENTKAAATSLKITKTVSGSAANKNDEFAFTITVNGIDGTYSTNKASVTVTNGTATTFTLKHGETFEIKNLPAGATYTVNETDAKGYDETTVSVNGGKADTSKTANGTVDLSKTNTVAYTNIDTVIPPTGVILHFVPFLLAFAAAFGGCLVFFRRKRI